MNSFLRSGASAEGQLKRMFDDPGIRYHLGAHGAVASGMRNETGEAIGPGQIAPVSSNQEAIAKRAQILQGQLQAKAAPFVETKVEGKEVFDSGSPLPSRVEVQKAASNFNQGNNARIKSEQSAVDDKHASIAGNVNRYQREEKGAGTVFANAFLGGLGYKGPMEQDNKTESHQTENKTTGKKEVGNRNVPVKRDAPKQENGKGG